MRCHIGKQADLHPGKIRQRAAVVDVDDMARPLTSTRTARPVSLSGDFRRSISRIVMAQKVRRKRKALLTMDAHLLCNIGLSRDESVGEASRSVWDAPDRWRN